MKTKLQYLRALSQKAAAKTAAAGALTMTGIGVAAASDGGATSSASEAFGELQSQASQMASDAWPVVVGVVGSLLAISLFKKFANRAT
ncbi:major coat protein [Chromohalobacter sarecensis]|uniref:Major coat protein n=1 Tax=Chromohalobacter sarecensis TaxID=245294 RepID=A0ABV9CZ97_9GAMM|nr:major coat protein [Chromohalobacter sarecensis]MCK0713370.1 hypothetical protein [Chromohalobacter sarecensis]